MSVLCLRFITKCFCCCCCFFLCVFVHFSTSLNVLYQQQNTRRQTPHFNENNKMRQRWLVRSCEHQIMSHNFTLPMYFRMISLFYRVYAVKVPKNVRLEAGNKTHLNCVWMIFYVIRNVCIKLIHFLFLTRIKKIWNLHIILTLLPELKRFVWMIVLWNLRKRVKNIEQWKVLNSIEDDKRWLDFGCVLPLAYSWYQEVSYDGKKV